MDRRGLLLGAYATGAQVLLLREIVSSLGGTEFLIGAGLCGWLAWGALGALCGGRDRDRSPALLFAVGALLLPLSVILIRLAPVVFTHSVGERLLPSRALLVAFLGTLPVALTAGWIFPALVRRRGDVAESVRRVYLAEGLGACVAGVTVTLVVGTVQSTLGMALVLGALVFSLGWMLHRGARLPAAVIALLLFGLSAYGAPRADAFLDRLRYSGYEVRASFDTPYSHQAVLVRAGSTILLTDNRVEALDTDLAATENRLLPPVAFLERPLGALLVGRAELDVAPLIGRLSGIRLTAVDPRPAVGRRLAGLGIMAAGVETVSADPLTFLAGGPPGAWDVIILSPGDLDSYRNSRLFTGRILRAARRALSERGLLYFVVDCDTERYVTPEDARVLGVICATLKTVFAHVEVWPGTATSFFAGRRDLSGLTPDTVAARVAATGYVPQYLTADYLRDRLDPFRLDRVRAACTSQAPVNRLDLPVLAHLQSAARTRVDPVGRWLLRGAGQATAVMVVLPFLLFFVRAVAGGRRTGARRYGLVLLFLAGLVSLGAEILSFYLFQAVAGTLYTHLAALIGLFMLGLSVGAYMAARTRPGQAEGAALVVLFTSVLLFGLTALRVPGNVALFYHAGFQFLVAFGTGMLFVAAGGRYYTADAAAHRGLAYACELAGAACGAFLLAPVLLPLWGLQPVLALLAGMIVVAALGARLFGLPR